MVDRIYGADYQVYDVAGMKGNWKMSPGHVSRSGLQPYCPGTDYLNRVSG